MLSFENISEEEAQFRIFIEACAWFYGNLSSSDAFDLYKNHYKVDLTKKLFREYIRNFKKSMLYAYRTAILPLSDLYCDAPASNFWDDEIIYSALLEDETRKEPLYYAVAHHKLGYHIPLCILPWQEFMYVSRYGSIRTSNEKCDAATEFFMNCGLTTKRKIENFIDRLIYNTHLGKDFFKFLKNDPFYKSLLQSMGRDLDSLNRGLALITEISNHTSTMANNGYSPAELGKALCGDEKNDSSPEPAAIVFTERMRNDIKNGFIGPKMFAQMISRYPLGVQKAALKEYQRIVTKR